MAILGILLVVIGVVFGVDLLANNRFVIRDISVFGTSLGLHGSGRLFVLGAITGGVIILGLALLVAGGRRRSTKARALRRQRREKGAATATDADSLRAENAELRQRLERNRAGDGAYTGGAYTGGGPAADRSAAPGATTGNPTTGSPTTETGTPGNATGTGGATGDPGAADNPGATGTTATPRLAD